MKKGFTLIELLIAIAIISLLAAATIALFDGAKLKSRDSRRVSDMKEIQNGLTLYFTDHSAFPIAPAEVEITGEDPVSQALLDGDYMKAIPTDPSPNSNYTYISSPSGSTYQIEFCIEGDSIQSYAQGCHTVTP